MIIVTGGAGFIGSNIVKGLNEAGYNDIIVVDNLTEGKKFRNIADCNISDYVDQEDFLAMIQEDEDFDEVKAIYHQGACSDTTEWDGHYMMENNYAYSKACLHYAIDHSIPFYYASSAAVYGGGKIFQENPAYEAPLNVYGYSKLLFDQYIRTLLPEIESPVVGLRYFNVYGPRESHKGKMASVAFHLNNQWRDTKTVRLFEGADGYGHGEQQRDFIYVSDVVAVNLWLLTHPEVSGIFNVGTGHSQTFNAIARAVLNWHGTGKLEYIPFPASLQGCYQSFTEANMSALRAVGYDATFKTVEIGVSLYLAWLAEHPQFIGT